MATTSSDPSSLARSFEDFFEVERDGLLSALYLITGNRHDAEELMQEAFLKIWERWSTVESLANPTGYLYHTALNLWRMRLRRARIAARRLLGSRAKEPALAMWSEIWNYGSP